MYDRPVVIPNSPLSQPGKDGISRNKVLYTVRMYECIGFASHHVKGPLTKMRLMLVLRLPMQLFHSVVPTSKEAPLEVCAYVLMRAVPPSSSMAGWPSKPLKEK